MFYKLLGIAVWKGLKALVRSKTGRTNVPVPLLAGGIVAVLLALALVLRRDSDDA